VFGGVRLDCGPEGQRVLIDDGLAWWSAAFSTDGRFLAAATYEYRRSPEGQMVKVVDLESGEVLRAIAMLEEPQTTDQREGRADQLCFTPGGNLLCAGWGGVRRRDLDAGTWQWLYEWDGAKMSMTADGRLLLVGGFAQQTIAVAADELRLLDLSAGTSRAIERHGGRVTSLAIDPTGSFIATGSEDGAVRVGSAADDHEPHHLLGHDGLVHAVAFSPDGRWVASEASDGVRLWPMPDLSEPPFHTLPHEQLMARLDALTNVIAVRDPDATTGWTTEVGPFPGWDSVPEW
jgi:WD40 repeat protein